jgi:NurA-like 5'-3' nuclease
MAKVSELWEEVEKSLAEKTLAGSKMAVLEAHKVLELVLKTEGYPGKIERQLNLAGFSLSEKDPIAEAIKKQKEILASFEYQLSDFEATEIVAQYIR